MKALALFEADVKAQQNGSASRTSLRRAAGSRSYSSDCRVIAAWPASPYLVVAARHPSEVGTPH